jgi:hypothetical protein
MHPVAMEGYRRYFKGKKKLEADDLEALRGALVELTPEPRELWGALTGLGLLAVLVEGAGDQESGRALRELIASKGQHLAPIADEVARALGVESAEAIAERNRGAHRQLTTGESNHRAVFHDAPRPENTLLLYEVDFAMVSRSRDLRLVRHRTWRVDGRSDRVGS